MFRSQDKSFSFVGWLLRGIVSLYKGRTLRSPSCLHVSSNLASALSENIARARKCSSFLYHHSSIIFQGQYIRRKIQTIAGRLAISPLRQCLTDLRYRSRAAILTLPYAEHTWICSWYAASVALTSMIFSVQTHIPMRQGAHAR